MENPKRSSSNEDMQQVSLNAITLHYNCPTTGEYVGLQLSKPFGSSFICTSCRVTHCWRVDASDVYLHVQ